MMDPKPEDFRFRKSGALVCRHCDAGLKMDGGIRHTSDCRFKGMTTHIGSHGCFSSKDVRKANE